MPEIMGGGVALFDADRDGDLDVLCIGTNGAFDSVAADEMDHKRKRVVVGAVALMGLLGVVLTLVLWVNDESKSARPSKLGASETTASGAAPVKSIGWDDIKEQMNQPVPEPNQPTEVADLDEVATDAGSELSTKGDGTRSRARRSGSRAGHVAPAAPKASPAPKPTALPEKDFDPFEKRH
jgi:hypothetical protein